MPKKKLTIDDVIVPMEEIPYEVPENWCWVKLGSIVNIKTGRKDANHGTEDGEYTFFTCAAEPIKSPTYSFEGEAILLAGNGANVGLALYYDGKFEAYQRTYVLQSDKINIKYLLYNLQFRWKDYNENKQFGSATNYIKLGNITEYELVLPPLAEQVRIVNRIESIFDKVDRAAGLVEEARYGFEKRRAAILERAFCGELTRKWREENGVSENWKTIKFKELGKLERGRSKHRPRNDERLFGGKYPFIQTGDIANSNGYIYNHKQTLSDFGLEQSRLFPIGTLCITIAANIGDVAILTYDCCFPDSVVGFTPNDYVESKFIYYYLNLIKRDLEHYAPATAQKNINLAILGALDIPKPSIEEQRQIVEILEKSLDNESKVEELIDLDDNIDLIKKSILAKAFRGELASNDLNEKISIALLKT